MTSFTAGLQPARQRARRDAPAGPSDSASARAGKARARGTAQKAVRPTPNQVISSMSGTSTLRVGGLAAADAGRSGGFVGINAGPEQPRPERHDDEQHRKA